MSVQHPCDKVAQNRALAKRDARLLKTRATKLREKIAGVTSVLVIIVSQSLTEYN